MKLRRERWSIPARTGRREVGGSPKGLVCPHYQAPPSGRELYASVIIAASAERGEPSEALESGQDPPGAQTPCHVVPMEDEG